MEEIGHKMVQDEPSITWQFDSEAVLNLSGFIENVPLSLRVWGAYRTEEDKNLEQQQGLRQIGTINVPNSKIT